MSHSGDFCFLKSIFKHINVGCNKDNKPTGGLEALKP